MYYRNKDRSASPDPYNINTNERCRSPRRHDEQHYTARKRYQYNDIEDERNNDINKYDNNNKYNNNNNNNKYNIREKNNNGMNKMSGEDFDVQERRLKKRQRQVDLGKNTIPYDNYITSVPKNTRKYHLRFENHPLTPDVHQTCSKRSFDGQIRKWKKLLHQYYGNNQNKSVVDEKRQNKEQTTSNEQQTTSNEQQTTTKQMNEMTKPIEAQNSTQNYSNDNKLNDIANDLLLDDDELLLGDNNDDDDDDDELSNMGVLKMAETLLDADDPDADLIDWSD